MEKVEKPVEPGETFIAYVDDTNTCVGVVIENESDTKSKVLILAHMSQYPDWGSDVFSKPFPYTFPTYVSMESRRLTPYTFEEEISLCIKRDYEWWKAEGRCCTYNLIAHHFRPNNVKILLYVQAVQHILNGGDYDSFKSFDYLYDQVYFQLWAELNYHFPERTAALPDEWDCLNSNGFYKIEKNDSGPAIIKLGFRSHDYKKKK